ncbi:ComEC/Rec2 family competence protein [Flavobacterium hungaricum]|uniref:ComEC family competence protein n=1 Tax=Flavobacterium hungaricum TaxID=2082725 RepID=A0ABR9TIX8_9FLAO|nr:ComEC/Rec2 family competence protein [Flavobacterium hungaricum]MBE8725285.1 ComEC family competence protein [Flavobacterium hungaricum]
MKVLDFPLAKVTIGFVTGIILSYYQHFSTSAAIIIFCLSSLLFITLFTFNRGNKKLAVYFGVSVYLISFSIGILTLLFHTEKLHKTNYTHLENVFTSPKTVTLTIREKLKSNDYSDRYIALVNTINNKSFSGRIILNVQKDSIKTSLIIGNIIQLKTILQRNNPNKNPNQFDYSQYLADKQIYAQIHCHKSEILVNSRIEKDIWFYTGKLHSRIVRHLEKASFSKDEMTVALALILGQQQEIAADIIQDYQYSGATHVLSVSGLHVGFIMLFITFILKPIPNNRKGSLLKLTAILVSLGMFAVISGLSPSVLRSVVMFSFLACGNHLRRNGNIYHTLLVSILLILLFQPYFLFDVGFQLSYIALFFILWLQPLLKKLWTPKHKISTYIWDALTVSFAAQIGTFPLCLYYFHQFPSLFFVTNIVILPILSFIMIAGIIVMIIAVFAIPPDFIIQIFQKSVFLLNYTIHIVASMESFVIKNISFNFYYLIAFYVLTFAIIIYYKKRSYSRFVFILVSIIFTQTAFILTKEKTQSEEELIVYNSKKSTIISDRKGSSITLFSRDTLPNQKTEQYILTSYLIENYITSKRRKKLENLLYFNNNKILIIDSSGIIPPKCQPDILLLTQSPKLNLDRILDEIKPKTIIADASNSYSFITLWKKSCLKNNIPFHATAEKGYYKF